MSFQTTGIANATSLMSVGSQIAPLIIDQNNDFHKPHPTYSRDVFWRDTGEAVYPTQQLTGNFPYSANQDKTINFEIPKNRAFVDMLSLHWTESAGAANVGQLAAQVEYAGHFKIRVIRVKHGNQVLQELYPDSDILEKKLREHSITREDLDSGSKGGQFFDLATRQGLFATAQEFHVDIPNLWFRQGKSPGESYVPEAYANFLTVEVVFKPSSLWIETDDGNAPLTAPEITDIRILTAYYESRIEVKGREIQRRNHSEGIIQKFIDIQPQLETFLRPVAALNVADEHRVQLSNFTMDVQYILFFVSAGNYYRTAYGNKPYDSTPTGSMLRVLNFDINSGAQKLKETDTDLLNRIRTRRIYFPNCQVGDFIYIIPFADDPTDKVNATGHHNLATRHNITLRLSIVHPEDAANPGNPAPVYFNAYAFTHNGMHSANGSIKKLLS